MHLPRKSCIYTDWFTLRHKNHLKESLFNFIKIRNRNKIMEYIMFTDDITQNSFSKHFKLAALSFLIKKAYL